MWTGEEHCFLQYVISHDLYVCFCCIIVLLTHHWVIENRGGKERCLVEPKKCLKLLQFF